MLQGQQRVARIPIRTLECGVKLAIDAQDSLFLQAVELGDHVEQEGLDQVFQLQATRVTAATTPQVAHHVLGDGRAQCPPSHQVVLLTCPEKQRV